MQHRLKQITTTIRNIYSRLPKRRILIVGAPVGLLLVYVFAFVIEKPVLFSYAGETCVKQTTLLPLMHKQASSSSFDVQFRTGFDIGGYPFVASETCFIPRSAPKSGNYIVTTSPYGGFVAKKSYRMTVGDAPLAQTQDLTKPIPVTKPLNLKLTTPDTTFAYALKIGDKEAGCDPREQGITCDITKLGLVQGSRYAAELTRHFRGEGMATVIEKEIETLSATTVTDSSIKPGEIVFSKPKTIDIILDKPLVQGAVSIVKVTGDVREKINSQVVVTATGLQVVLDGDLARQSSYELTVDRVEAKDGSGLVEPYKLSFQASGGPKVTGVSVGRTGVALGSTAIITFDQALSDKQDIAKAISTGGGASIVKRQGNQVFVSLANVGKCADFSITINDTLESSYDIAGGTGWSYGGRMICHSIQTIGYSTRGRAINAYYFGSGPTVVMFTGAIHGSEPSTKALMDRWIQELEANARSIPADKTVVVVPQINPDGIASGSRTNARNVDLNRNFGTSDWQKDITTTSNQPFPGGGGESAMSEAETKAISGLAQRLRPALILSYHSIGSLVAANQVGVSNARAATYSSLSGYRNTTGQTGSTFEYSISGTADDWYGERLGVASVLIELGSHSYHQFERNQAAMWAMVRS